MPARLQRMGSAAPAVAMTAAPALQVVPVDLLQTERVVASPAATVDIRIELERAGLQVKLQCPASAGPLYAAQLRALADVLCAG